MNKKTSALFLLFSVSTALGMQHPTEPAQPKNLLICDTDGKPSHANRNLLLLAKTVGFLPTYATLFDALQNPSLFNSFSTIFCILSQGLIKNNTSLVSKRILSSIEQFAQAGNKNIGIFLPQKTKELKEFTPILKRLINSGLPKPPDKLESFIQKKLLPHDATIGRMVGTTLLEGESSPASSQLEHLHSKVIKELLPLSFFLKNSLLHNNYMISRASDFNFADIKENSFRNPHDLSMRNSLLNVAMQSLAKFYRISNAKQGTPPTNVQLDQIFTERYIHQKKEQVDNEIKKITTSQPKYQWINEGISCAWLEPSDFTDRLEELKLKTIMPIAEIKKLKQEVIQLKSAARLDQFSAERSAHLKERLTTLQKVMPTAQANKLRQQALEQGVNVIFNAGFNMLWLSFNPEKYLSPNPCSHQVEQFFTKTRLFLTRLKEKYNAEEKPLPKIFVSSDVTTNFSCRLALKREQNNTTWDIYGNEYPHVPALCDFDNLWLPEVIMSVKKFCKQIKGIVPISGVFLDLEMYHAQNEASVYTDCMDFSELAWSIYRKSSPLIPETTSVTERITYLINHKKFKDYFSVLQKRACQIGNLIKTSLREEMPELLFAVYLPTLPSSWFYKGILQGLSSPHEPVFLVTFNNDFYSHYDWLKENNIHVMHGGAVLLSKFQVPEDFEYINKTIKKHNFVWFNRPSRLVYSYDPKRWWHVESSPLPVAVVTKKINEHVKQGYKKREGR